MRNNENSQDPSHSLRALSGTLFHILAWLVWGLTAQSTQLGQVEQFSLANHTFRGHICRLSPLSG